MKKLEESRNIIYPLTFENIKTTKFKTIEGRKNYVKSEIHQTNKYVTFSFYKPICTSL